MMADGCLSNFAILLQLQHTNQVSAVNQARAMRVAEIMNDYRNIQNRISTFRISPSADEYNEVGYALFRQCESDARALLSQPFQTVGSNGRDDEQIKTQLRR